MEVLLGPTKQNHLGNFFFSFPFSHLFILHRTVASLKAIIHAPSINHLLLIMKNGETQIIICIFVCIIGGFYVKIFILQIHTCMYYCVCPS